MGKRRLSEDPRFLEAFMFGVIIFIGIVGVLHILFD
jgi:hypothetical protein